MSLSGILVTLAEVVFGGIIIWGFWHEEKFVEFEDKIFKKMGFNVRKKRSAKITRFDSSYKRNKHCI